MSDVVIVDTSVLLNLLNVPEYNDDREAVFEQFEELVKTGATFFLPLATVLETGGHIADVRDGRRRRRSAEVFRERVTEAINGKAPWRLVPLPDANELAEWLESFPERAMQGISLSDLSQMKLWESLCRKLFGIRVRIWSLDEHLRGYDRKP